MTANKDINAGISAIGWWLPKKRIDSTQISKRYGISHEALEKIGLKSRVVPSDNDHPINMGARATAHALKAAKLNANDIDLLIYAGVTKDWPSPYVAAFGVIHELSILEGNTSIPAAGMDISTRCAGSIDALWLAKTLIESGTYKTIVVCCAERLDKMLGAHRSPELTTDACYAGGAAAAIIRADADNNIVAFSNFVNPDLSIHNAMGPIAGGTREPFSTTTLNDKTHLWQGQLSMRQMSNIAQYSAKADKINYPRVMNKAGFDAIDFAVCSPLDPSPQLRVLNELGINTDSQILTVQTLGHIGPADLFLILGIAVSLERKIGTRLVLSTRTPTYSNAIAIRSYNEISKIAVSGEGINTSDWN